MVIQPIPDFAGDGGKHAIADIMKTQGMNVPVDAVAKWFGVAVVSGTGTGRIGDSTVSATCGFPFGPAAPFNSQFISQPIAELTSKYKLSGIFVLAPSGMTISIALGI